MPLSWNEIKHCAMGFSREWADETSEDAEAKSFWDGFFNVFDVSRRRVASFEQPVKKSDGHGGFIDLLWKGILLVEHKSRGKDLDRAFQQAKDYFPGLKEADLPRYVLVSDFARFRLYDLDENTEHAFTLPELHKNLRLFGFIAGYQSHSYQEQDPVNLKAAERMGRLHDQLNTIGYQGHALERYLVRLLFCLFAEDTGIFERRAFQDLIEQRTATDGSDLAGWLAQLFHTLDTPDNNRLKNLDEQLTAFPYVNGALFTEMLPPAAFDDAMRSALLDVCALDWSRISPAIFGSLFQSVMDAGARRNLGAHYTSEKNILKLIGPLFLDRLRDEFAKLKNQPKKLFEFHQKLARLSFFDPACGCGNFLVIAYRELRVLELEVIRALYGKTASQSLDVAALNILCDVDQFYGIEIEEFPAQIAQTALWLVDHQMNLQVSEEFGGYFVRLPLKKSASITHGNALALDWRAVCPVADYILGNPPFLGKKEQNTQQKAEVMAVFHDVKSAGVLDYVACWYRKANDYMMATPAMQAAFVSTNSITQGEQVGVLWPDLLKRGLKIHFAHRTFEWSNEAKGKAAVHCVIIGFGLSDTAEKTLFEYEHIKGEPHAIVADNINPYLVDGPDVVVSKRMKPLCEAPEMDFGSKAADFGFLTLSVEERDQLIRQYPEAKKWIREFIGSEEFINGTRRYCLWLIDCPPNELRVMPPVLERIKGVRQMRAASSKASTREKATTPAVFTENRQPSTDYLLIPKVSSERRTYVPLGFLQQDIIVNPTVLVVPNATLYHFGVLQSAMHNAWMRAVCGRMKSDYQYSNTIVYNNFPWPEIPPSQSVIGAQQNQTVGLHCIQPNLPFTAFAKGGKGYLIATAAQAVLDARAKHPRATLADLYDPLSMPLVLVKAHQKLDAAVDAAYGKQKFSGDAERVAWLFQRYKALINES